MKRPGAWAAKAAPRWSFTLYDASERLGVSVRWTRELVKRHHIPTGLVRRVVRLGDGSLRMRRLRVLSPSALEMLLLRHGGFTPTDESQKENRRC